MKIKLLALFLLCAITSLFAQSKIYIHTDRAVYSPNETLYFSGVVCNKDLSLNTNSTLLYLELYDASNSFTKLYLVQIRKGKVHGQIKLSEHLPLGSAYFKAYVGGEYSTGNNYYTLPIAIVKNTIFRQTEPSQTKQNHAELKKSDPIKTSISLIKEKPQLLFYAEGGELVAGSRQKLGILSANSENYPIAIKGEIHTSDNSKTIPFETDCDGMGYIDANFLSGKTYTAHLQINDTIFTYELPLVKASGYAISVQNKKTQYNVYTTIRHGSNARLEVYGNGKELFSEEVTTGTNTLIAKAILPEGISKIRLLDSINSPLCERLIFKPYTTPKTELTFDKQEYFAGDTIHYKLTGADGFYSASFIDKGFPNASEIVHPSLEKSLLFFNELKHLNPYLSAYAGNKNIDDFEYIEKLLLTYGWRNLELPEVCYKTEDKLYFKGRVLSPLTGLPKKNKTILVNIKHGKTITPVETTSDDEGRFEIPMDNFSGRTEFKLYVLNKKKGIKNALFEVETNSYSCIFNNVERVSQVEKTKFKHSPTSKPISFNLNTKRAEEANFKNSKATTPSVVSVIDTSIASTVNSLENTERDVANTYFNFTQRLTPKETYNLQSTKTIQWQPRNNINKPYNFPIKIINGDILVVIQGMTNENKPFSIYKTIKVKPTRANTTNIKNTTTEDTTNGAKLVYDNENLLGKDINYADFLLGKVYSAETRKPIKQVLVKTSGGLKTLTNAEGLFLFPKNQIEKDSLLSFSYPGLAYTSIRIDPHTSSPIIYLKSDSLYKTLETLEIKALKNAYKKTLTLRKRELSEIYYREIATHNNSLYALNEYQYKYYIPHPTGEFKTSISLIKARNMESTDYSKQMIIRPLTSKFENIANLDYILSPPDFLKNYKMKYFDYKIEGEINYKGSICKLITFDQKSEVKEALQSGTILIDNVNGVILYMEFGLSKKGIEYYTSNKDFNQNFRLNGSTISIRYTNGFSFDGGNVFLDFATEHIILESAINYFVFEKELVATKSEDKKLKRPYYSLDNMTNQSLLIKEPNYRSAFWKNTAFIMHEKEVKSKANALNMVNLYTTPSVNKTQEKENVTKH